MFQEKQGIDTRNQKLSTEAKSTSVKKLFVSSAR